MSIFKSTFSDSVKKQLSVRQQSIQRREVNDLQYFNARNSWIRMCSAVDVGGDGGKLAKENILQGGLLYNGKLRSGIGNTGSEQYSTVSPSGQPHRLGIRPMPGITNIEVKSKSAYGSLREVTVNFHCWDIKQLEDLELLYMRPGYTVLVEWGWAPFLDLNGNLQQTPPFYGDDFFKQGQSKEQIWKSLHEKASSTANYDALYGFVKNYSWKARKDGGYDCTTTIISIGEIMESLKVNYTPAESSIASSKNGLFYKRITGNQISQDVIEAYSQNIIAGLAVELFELVKSRKTGEFFSFNIKDNQFGGKKYQFYSTDIKISSDEDNAFSKSDTQVYITLESFVEILNNYVLLQTIDGSNKKVPLAKISVNDSTITGKGEALLCTANRFQLSTDPTICLIKNSLWADPLLSFGVNGDYKRLKNIMISLPNNYEFFYKNEPSTSLGVVGNIFINLNYIYKLCTDTNLEAQDRKEKRDIALVDFLKTLMNGISSSTGNVSTFDIFVDPLDSTARIIDVAFTGDGRDKIWEEAFKIEMHNTKSVVRNYSLESQIFPEQSTMISIAAQVQGGALGTDTSTLIDFNRGIVDRIIVEKNTPNSPLYREDPAKEITERVKNLASNFNTLIQFIEKLDSKFLIFNDQYDPTKASSYSNALKDIINFFKIYFEDEGNNRAIIPTKLSIEMDGIGGLIIGNIFKIDPSLLPRGYKGEKGIGPEKLAYVVTGIDHSLNNNDWVTKITAQLIVLDKPNKNKTLLNYTKLPSIVLSTISGQTEAVTKYLSQARTGNGQISPSNQKYPVLVKFNDWKKSYGTEAQKYAKVSNGITPVANELRASLDRAYITEKGSEISSNGDITPELKDTVLRFQTLLKSKRSAFKFITQQNPIVITAGNDTYHRVYGHADTSTHGRGLAIDIRTTTFTKPQIDSIMALLYEAGFAWVDYHGGSALHIHANLKTT